MGQLTPEFTMDLERRMRIIGEREYERLTSNLYWTRIAKELTSTGKSERLTWLLDSAGIRYEDRLGGSVEFEDILSQTTEFENKAATAGLKLNRAQLDDHDGGGVGLAAHWSREMGAYSAYWPQKQIADAIRIGGETASTTYDGEIYFSAAHPVNPFDTAAGTFQNDLTGAASGAFPGAVPIDDTVTVDVAFENLGKAIAFVQSLKMPNGEDPRMLRAAGIVAPPRMTQRVQQLTNAKIIAQAAASGGGGADVEAVISNWGLAQPIEAPELGLGFGTGSSDTTWYLLVESITSNELGALIYQNRDPFQMIFHGPMTAAELARKNEFQWVTRGRNVVGYGHPYLMFRCQRT